MTMALKSFWDKVGGTSHANGFSKAAASDSLFPKTDPTVDGVDCLRDCESCTIRYPRKWSIDEEEQLYGHVKGWSTHLIVATGKSDWVRDVIDEKGSIMEAVDKCGIKPSNGRMMLSASDMSVADERCGTTVLLLPSFTLFDHVTPQLVPVLIRQHVDTAPTNTTPLIRPQQPAQRPPDDSSSALAPPRDWPHDYLILLCSHKTRDARCGQSAPLLRREFERQLRPLGLYRDLHDDRPGGCAVHFINHVGGHKFAANVLIYRRVENAAAVAPNGDAGRCELPPTREAAQCMWLARVRPEDCENIVRYTILQGKLVKPERQLRGGFDRGRQLVSW